MNRYSRRPGRGKAAGFSLIEVMVAVLVLGVGLLGFALLQTMSVRFTQSANQRTQATNLAYDMLDQMRVNRLAAGQYVGNYAAATSGAGCVPGGNVSAAARKAKICTATAYDARRANAEFNRRWQQALPPPRGEPQGR